jgi:hypothetical protein
LIGGVSSVSKWISAARSETTAITLLEQESLSASEEMPQELFNRIKTSFERRGGVIDQTAEAQLELQREEAEALTKSANKILLPPNPTKAQVYEELIHTAQFRTGRYTGFNAVEMEIQAQEKLIRFQKAYGIPDSEMDQIRRRLISLRQGTAQ